MKVRLDIPMRGLSGKTGRMIYYYDRRSGLTLARSSFTFKNHPQHPGFRQVQKQIYSIEPSQGYIYNLKDYISNYNFLPGNELQQIRTWTNLYNRIMYALQKALPGQVDLASITRQQIYDQDLPCKSVKTAVEAGLIPALEGYERWSNLI